MSKRGNGYGSEAIHEFIDKRKASMPDANY